MTIAGFSEKSNFIESFSLINEKSILAPRLFSAKHISKIVVINPPEPISCPAIIMSFLIRF